MWWSLARQCDGDVPGSVFLVRVCGLWWICTVALVVFIRTGGRGGEDDKMTVGEGSVWYSIGKRDG